MTEQYITKDMNIGEAVQKHREAAFVMFKYGLHCIGCHVSAFESIESGCKGHGMPDDVIDEMIDEINKTIEEEQKKAAQEPAKESSAAKPSE